MSACQIPALPLELKSVSNWSTITTAYVNQVTQDDSAKPE